MGPDHRYKLILSFRARRRRARNLLFPASEIDHVERTLDLNPHRLRAGFRRQQLPQHILQNPAVGVVKRLLRRIDAH